MLNQSFEYEQFRKLQRRGDLFWVNCDKGRIKRKLENLEKQLRTDIDNYTFSSLSKIKKNSKTVYFIDNKKVNFIEDEFILRKINHNIKRIYKVQQSDRNLITSQILKLLGELKTLAPDQKYYIYRLDISSFYESIDRNKILNKIFTSSIVSIETKILLEKLFLSLQTSEYLDWLQLDPLLFLHFGSLSEQQLEDLSRFSLEVESMLLLQIDYLNSMLNLLSKDVLNITYNFCSVKIPTSSVQVLSSELFNYWVQDSIYIFLIDSLKFQYGRLFLNKKGLPRGLNISSTLSEIYMKDFDRSVIKLKGVFYYARFVDYP